MPPGGKRKWLRFLPGGVFVSKNKDDDIQKYIAIFYEGGDSEWFINYPSFIIKGICEQSVSKF
mgnify:CR=1 FL=1